jgi:hypothetical protein
VTPGNPNAAMTSYASNYQNVSPTQHPSEPNYVYQVAGATGPLNDNDPRMLHRLKGGGFGYGSKPDRSAVRRTWRRLT